MNKKQSDFLIYLLLKEDCKENLCLKISYFKLDVVAYTVIPAL